MTAVLPQQADTSQRCAICGGAAEFGYRNKQTGKLIWYCAAHRLGQFWADASLALPASSNGKGATDDKDFEQSDRSARYGSAKPTRRSLSEPVDGAKRNRPDPGADGAKLAGRADRVALPQAEASPLEPHFDAESRFIHYCCRCDKPAMLGFGVALRAGKLGTWYCGGCAPAQTNKQGDDHDAQQNGGHRDAD